ncbi:HAD family hydrolase [Streptomyces sp. NPDC001544]|uniref:HAD family hydrolase n=1 Tax=Streptomyces sp. NPDC001544 TaxID=3364584 RepID=UPI0036B1476B
MVRRPLGNHQYGPDTLLVTSDTAQTDLVARQRAALLRDLVRNARVVLWDFDGPICSLFARHSAHRVAAALRRWLRERGLRELLAEVAQQSPDPHELLRAVYCRRPGSDLVAELEERLTREELLATAGAMPTAHADPLIRTWTAVGSRLAVTSNNSARAVRAYLANRGLLDCFAPHIYGRTQDLGLLKPDPYCLNRALTAMGAAPATALMIGDAVTDFAAASLAGVSFIGYAADQERLKALEEAGAQVVVDSLDTLLRAVRET